MTINNHHDDMDSKAPITDGQIVISLAFDCSGSNVDVDSIRTTLIDEFNRYSGIVSKSIDIEYDGAQIEHDTLDTVTVSEYYYDKHVDEFYNGKKE